MAYTKDQFLRELAIWTTAGAVGLKNTGRFLAYAGKKGINLAAFGLRKSAVPAARGALGLGRLAAGTNPGTLALLGGLTLYEAQQMGLLDEPIERTRQTGIDAVLRGMEEMRPFMPTQTPEEMFQGLDVGPAPTKRKPTKYNKAVKAGMATVKASQYFGKKGTISNPKKAFITVNRTASKVNRGKKVSTKGVAGKIARAVRRILK